MPREAASMLRRRSLPRLGAYAALLLVLGTLIGPFVGRPAEVSAHASVSETSPVDGSVVETRPEFVEILFNEPVTVGAGTTRLVDADGAVSELSIVSSRREGSGDRVRWAVPTTVRGGWYAVTWRAVSADGHGISGSFTFYFGDPAVAGDADRAVVDDDPAAKFITISHLLRIGTYLSVLIAVGALSTLWAVSGPLTAAAAPRAAGTLRGVATAAAVTGLVLTPLTLLNNALLLNGGSRDSLGVIVQIVLQSSGGAALLVRMSALFGVCTAVLLLAERGTRAIGVVIGFVAAVGLALSFALGGHAAVVPWRIPASVAEVLHLVAGSVWLGGMPTVAWLVARRTDLGLGAIAELVGRFSRLATLSVFAVLIGGTVLSVTMLTSPDEIVTTRYGVVLLVKFVVVAGIAGVGAYNHFVLVPLLRKASGARGAEADGQDEPAVASDGTGESTTTAGPDEAAIRRHLRISLTAEAAALALVVVVTGVLTSFAAPAAGGNHFAGGGHSHLGGGGRDIALTLALDDLEPTIVRTPMGAGEATIEYLPGRTDAVNRFTLSVTDASGEPRAVVEATASFTQTTYEIGPIERALTPQGDGTWSLETRDLGVAGEWTLTILVNFADGEVDTAEFTLNIKPRSIP